MKTRVLAVCVLALTACAGAASAQERPQRPDRPEGGRAGARDEAFKMIDAYLVSNLQESVGLTDEQFTRLLPLVKKLQSDRRELAQRRFRAMAELRSTLAAGGATEQAVGQLLQTLKKAEADEPVALKRDEDAIDATLSVVQQAKFRVMQGEVEMKIRQLMLRARGDARRGARRNTPDEQP